MSESRFLVFEGIDGSGKSTLLRRLATYLTAKSIAYLETREPGGTPLAEEIRRLLLHEKNDSPVDRAEMLLYLASRAQHVDKVIQPALNKGQWVLCDRFAGSTYAFQGKGRGIAWATVEKLNDFATGGLQPDLYILLDLSVEASRERQKGRKLDRIESQAESFHQNVRSAYIELAQTQNNWLLLDASLSPDLLFEKLRQYLEEKKWLHQ